MKKGILGALPIVAAAYAERFGVPVNVGGDIAYTDGKAIQIPAIEKSYGNMDVVWGYLAHEAAHIKWSDFEQRPGSLFASTLLNALEDCRIEAAMIREYPGTAVTLGALDEFLISTQAHTVPDEQAHPGAIVIAVCLFWGMANVVGKQMFDPLLQGALQALNSAVGRSFSDRLLRLLQNDLPRARSTQDVHDLVVAIIGLMQDESSQQAQAQCEANTQQDQQTSQDAAQGQSNQGAGSSATAPGDQADGASPGHDSDQHSPTGESPSQRDDGQGQGDGTGTQADGTSPSHDSDQHSPTGESPSQGDDGQSQGDCTGAHADGNTASGQATASAMPDVSQKGARSEQVTSGAADAVPAEGVGEQGNPPLSEHHQTAQQAASHPAVDESGSQRWLEQALSAGLNELPSDRMRSIRDELYAHEDRSAMYRTVRLAPDTGSSEWKGMLLRRAADKVGTRLQHELMGLVQSKARTAHKARDRGKRLDATRVLRVMSGDPRVFRVATERTSPNTAVHLLVDSSSSMSSNDRLHIAEASALALARALDAIKGVNPAVTYFGRSTDEPVRSAVRHGQKAATRSTYFNAASEGGTPMAEAIWYAAYALSKTSERRKMIMVITDGAPSNIPAAKAAINLAEEGGVEVVGIGIQTLACTNLFTRHIVIDSLGDLCQSVFRLMGDYLVSERAA